MMNRIPTRITACKLEVVLTPNGEIISLGKTLGWFDEFKKYLTID